MSISNVTEYKRYFGDFRGVDFSSDITQVSEKRFAAAVNVYKDYQTSNGNGIETIPGFRRRVEAPNKEKIFGIHTIKLYGENGDDSRKTFVHAGDTLYLWENFGKERTETEPSKEELTFAFGGMNERDSVSFVFNNRLYIIDGKNYLCFDGKNVNHVRDSAYIPTTYINIIPEGENADTGTEYEQRNMLSPYFKHTFIVTEYIPADKNDPYLSQEYYMNEPFDSIKEVKVYGFVLDEKQYSVDTKKGCVRINASTKFHDEYQINTPERVPMFDAEGYAITDEDGETVNHPEMYAGVEITAKRAIYQARDVRVKKADGTIVTYTAYQGDDAYVENSGAFSSMVERATVAAVFDNRVFLSGFPGKPNLIVYCARNNTGYSDPGYIGVLNYMQDGVGDSPITAMIPIANALLVLKSTSEHEGSVYYHTATETGFDIVPKVYPSESGLAGTGCLGAAINFLDDPVFVSSLGLEAIGQLSVRYERAREHRSSLVDSLLVNSQRLSEAKLCEWGGYLLLLVDGNVFMADSRQKYQHATGNIEYEWYYLEGIGVYEGGEKKTNLQESEPPEFYKGDEARKIEITYNDETYDLKVLQQLKEGEQKGLAIIDTINGCTAYDVTNVENIIEYKGLKVCMCRTSEGKLYAILAYESEEIVGGVFEKATSITSFYTGTVSNVYFGTENGVVCSFNFDKRNVEDGMIDNAWYTFDDHAIVSGVSLKMDNCGYPDSNKTTIKKSLVIKTRSMAKLEAKVNVRTNKTGTTYVDSIAATNGIGGMFSAMDFSDFTFNVSEMPMFNLNENQKKWVEKQYTIYSDEYQKPFSLIYMMYRYRIVGKYKG